jgi:hypothetical protein
MPIRATTIAYFGSINLYKSYGEAQKMFLKDLVFYICKCYRILTLCENIWLCKLMLHQCPRVVFPCHSSLMEHFFPTMVTKTMNKHVLLNLKSTTTISRSFEL